MPAKTILVVEDSDPTRRLIEMCLTMDGFNVVYSVDGESGLEKAREVLPDAIVLDIALPGINGWEVLEQLRNDPSTSDIPVVVATAHDSDLFRVQAQTATADAFVGKPFNLSDLRAAIDGLIGTPPQQES